MRRKKKNKTEAKGQVKKQKQKVNGPSPDEKRASQR